MSLCPICFRSYEPPGPEHDKDCPHWRPTEPSYGPATMQPEAPQPAREPIIKVQHLMYILKQVLLLAAFVAAPYLWWNRQFETFADFVRTTGAMLLFSAICYVALPIDLIPDWIPIIGKLDDYIATVAGYVGVSLLIFHYYIL